MEKKLTTKVIAGMLAFILTFANVILLGIYTQESIATSMGLEEQSKTVANANIEFDAYFKEGGEVKHSKAVDMSSNNDSIYLSIKVTDGYFKNGKISLNNANFDFAKANQELSSVERVDTETNTIILNQINKNESVVLEMPIKMKTDSSFDVINLDKISKVELEGKYVNKKGEEVKISKTIEVNAKMTAEAQANLEAEITKYVPYEVDELKGVALQIEIKSGIVNNVMPIKTSKIEIDIPKISEKEPERVTVLTKGTNGGEGKTFVKDTDYTYENGKVILTINNEKDANGKISWEKNAQDEIVLTCVYGAEAQVQTAEVELKVTNSIIIYDGKDTQVSGSVERTENLSSKIGEIVTYELDTDKEELSKGYMLVSGAKDTELKESWKVDIGNRELVDSITIESSEYYSEDDNQSYRANIPYKNTKISKENLISILGENGYINILDKDGAIIATLNKDNLEYQYSKDTTYIKVETSDPIAEGILKIENERGIKSGELEVSQLEKITKLAMTITGKALREGQEIFAKELLKKITLTNPQAEIESTINKRNLSTVDLNEGIEIRVELNTNDNTKVLYKNPRITLELPKYIENLTDTKVSLLYDDNKLQLNTANIKQSVNETGNIVVEIPIEGEQTEFNTSSVSNGAILVLQGNLKVDELAPAIKENIKVRIDNENTLDTTVEDEIEIRYAAENKVLTRNAISGYDGTNNKVSTMDETKTVTIKSDAKAKTAKIELDAVNSTGKEITDVNILGRVPFKGNKEIATNKDLGSTFSTTMSSKITVNGISAENVEVYYSENENATTKVSETSNGWTLEPSDLTKIKSYLIVLKNPMENGKKVSFSYNVQIPENIGEELKTYETFAVCYKENNALKIEEANKIGLITDKKEEIINTSTLISSNENLEAKVTMTEGERVVGETDTVKEGQYIQYTVDVKNKSNSNQEFELQVKKNNGNLYGKALLDYKILLEFDAIDIREEGSPDVEKMIGKEGDVLKETVKIKPNETYTYTYTLVVNKNTAGNNLESIISFVKDGQKVLNDLQTKNLIQNGLIKLNLQYNNPDIDKVKTGSVFPFIITATNLTDNALSNVVVEFKLPEILEYNDYFLYKDECECDKMDTSTKTLKFTINSLEVGKTNTLYIYTNVGDIAIDEEYRNMEFMATAKVNNETVYSNTYGKKIEQGKTQIVATMKGNRTEEYLKDGDELVYTIEVENRGVIDETALKIKDIVPEGLVVQEYTITDENGEKTTVETSYQLLEVSNIELKANSSMKLEIKTKVAESLAEGNVFVNKATIEGQYFEGFDTNSVSYKLKKQDDDNSSENQGQDSKTETFEINGIVWKDENLNGKRDTAENGMSGIQVKLMNNKKSEFVKDNSGREITSTTNANGEYKFEGLKSGEYVVVYVYDSNMYEPTLYQMTGINSDKNSDAIVGTVKINGQEVKVAMTDTVILGQADVKNLDLGLIQTKRFNLKLKKTVGTVIVQNKQGTKSYKFDTDLAKIEIPSKYMVGTNLTIEYKIKITNEGNVSGKVLKIVDNLPKDLEFNSEINNEWYKDTDGKIYTTEFENDTIEPGETKEITLVLTKVLKEEVGEITNNTAKIVETYNTSGLTNSNQDEKGLSKADLIVTIKTGVVTYITISLVTILMIAILGVGVYLIKKKVLEERI